MKTLIPVGLFLLLSLVTPAKGSHIGLNTQQNECTCDDHTEMDDAGRETGNCLTQYRGSNWCYIGSSTKCGDKKQSSKYPSLFWSQIACQTKSKSVTTEERIRKNEERIRRKGNTTNTNRSGSSSCTQFVTSPGYPGNYPRNFGPQETQIRVPEGNSIEITFQRFDIESCYWCSSRKCRWDWVEFKDGDGKVVGKRLCGDSLPSKFTISTSTASVSFRSDYSVQTTGYKICYESKPPGEDCQSNGKTRYNPVEDKMVGHCQTEYRGKFWCYVSSDSSCEDKKWTRRTVPGFRYWSALACELHPPF